MYQLQTKRIYAENADTDGFRILTDRLWPRGISKERAAIDLWAKDISPSTYLRKWFNHEEALYPKFREQYREELEKNPDKDDFIKTVKEQLTKDNVTLLFGAKEEKLNQATVLKEWLEEKCKEAVADTFAGHTLFEKGAEKEALSSFSALFLFSIHSAGRKSLFTGILFSYTFSDSFSDTLFYAFAKASPSALHFATPSSSGVRLQITGSLTSTAPAFFIRSSQRRIHSPSPQS